MESRRNRGLKRTTTTRFPYLRGDTDLSMGQRLENLETLPVAVEAEYPPKEGAKIMRDLMSRLRPEKWTLHQSVDLFGDATRAFDAEATEGAALLCRAALEAACYVYLYRDKDSKLWWKFNPPRYPDGRLKRLRFETLMEAVRKQGVLSTEHMEALARIKDDGDLIAHIAERQEREMSSARE